MISAAASTNRPKNIKDPAGISLLPDFMFLSLCRDHPGRSVTLAFATGGPRGELDTP